VPTINFWNEMLEKFHIEKGRFEYVDDKPENPHINYGRNYLHGVHELEKLMKICEENLHNILIKTFIIQGKQDVVVNPISGRMIYEKIHSKDKTLAEVDFSNHVIINGEKKEEIFKLIEIFLEKLN
jgi:esterase/lipase